MKKTAGRPKKCFYFGLDAGNGSIKIVGEKFEERIPSYKTEAYLAESLGSVQLNGLVYTVGRNAILSQKICKRTVDDKFAKVEDLQALYLGALAHFDCPSVMHNRIVVSSHAYATLKDKIIQSLKTEDMEVVLSGKQVRVTTDVLLIVPEGFGAIFTKKQDKFATLDFGNGTTVLTPYSKRKPGTALIEYYGVQRLIELISKEMMSINGGYPGDVDDIRRSLERGDLKLDGGEIDISDIYKKCLKDWWNDGLKKIMKEAIKMAEDGEDVVCIGGGVALPNFSKILSAKGFKPIDKHPEMANARGLYQLAMEKDKVNA